MRPCISILDENGTVENTFGYVNIPNSTARLYGADLTVLNNNIYAIAHGDHISTNLNKDLYLLKVKTTGKLTYTKKIEFPEDFKSSGTIHHERFFFYLPSAVSEFCKQIGGL